MKYNYIMVLERDGEKIDLTPEVEFNRYAGEYYGNGFYMVVEKCGFGFCNVFDCRYDTRLDENHLEEFFPVFARGYWDGKNGSCKLISITEIK